MLDAILSGYQVTETIRKLIVDVKIYDIFALQDKNGTEICKLSSCSTFSNETMAQCPQIWKDSAVWLQAGNNKESTDWLQTGNESTDWLKTGNESTDWLQAANWTISQFKCVHYTSPQFMLGEL